MTGPNGQQCVSLLYGRSQNFFPFTNPPGSAVHRGEFRENDVIVSRVKVTMCGRYSLICIDDLANRFRIFDPTLSCQSH